MACVPRSPALPPSLRRPLRIPCLDVICCSSTTRKGKSYHRAGGGVKYGFGALPLVPDPEAVAGILYAYCRRAEQSVLREASHLEK